MNNKNAYAVFFGSYDWKSSPDFAALFTKVEHKTSIPGVTNAYLFISDTPLTQWYQLADTTTAQAPIIVPIDLMGLQNVGNALPEFLKDFSQYAVTRAA